jgi:hypothetical protein
MTVPFTAGSSFDMLAYFDKIKRDRTGVNSDAEGLKPDQLKHIQQSVMGQSMDMARMKIEAIARIFAETGIKSLFMHLHELIAKHLDRKQMVQLRNRFVEVDPTRWRDRFDVTVNIGLGIATKESAMFMLDRIVALQEKIIMNGGMGFLVTPQNIYNTAAEITKAGGLKTADLYFTDPQGQQAPPQTSEQEQLAQLQAQIQQRQQELDAANLQLKEQQMMLRAEHDAAKLREDQEKREDKMAVEMEKLQNQILEIKLKYAEANQPLPRAKKVKYDPASGSIV